MTPPPETAPTGIQVSSFAPLGNAWFAVTNAGSAYLSRDEGGSWSRVDLSAPDGGSSGSIGTGIDFALGPDQAAYLGASGDLPVLIRVTGDGAVERLSLPVGDDDRKAIPTPAFDEQGRLWVALSNFRTNLSSSAPRISMLRLGPDRRTLAERIEFAVPPPFDALQALRFAGGDAYARYGQSVVRFAGRRAIPTDGPLAKIGPGNQWHQSPATLPAFAAGQVLIGFRAISLDGGGTWGQLWRGGDITPVAGDPSLLRRGNWILKRARGGFRVSGLGVPGGVDQLVKVPGGIVAVGGDKAEHVLHLHRGPVPDIATAGSPTAYTRALVARVNRFRAAAGVPPVIADGLLERAARNHAAYLARHRSRAQSTVPALHGEDRGRAGFTGKDAVERCAFEGADCTADVIEAGARLSRPVDDWIASVYHRLPLINATTTAVGAARAGRYVVLNYDETGRRGVGTGPIAFPRGRYDGPLGAVTETPDPRSACARNRQRIRRVGAAVTFQTPTEEPPALPNQAFVQTFPLPDVFEVTLTTRGRRVRGCTRIGYLDKPLQHIAFVPEGPLRRRTRYRAVARWRINREAKVQRYAWTFRTR